MLIVVLGELKRKWKWTLDEGELLLGEKTDVARRFLDVRELKLYKK